MYNKSDNNIPQVNSKFISKETFTKYISQWAFPNIYSKNMPKKKFQNSIYEMNTQWHSKMIYNSFSKSNLHYQYTKDASKMILQWSR